MASNFLAMASNLPLPFYASHFLNLGWRVATAITRISISVSGFMPAQGEPEERGFVERIPCPDTEQLAASVGGLRHSYLPRLDGLLKLSRQLSSKPERAHSRLKLPAIVAWHKVTRAAKLF